MANIGKPPCDEAAILTAGTSHKFAEGNVGRWVLAASILGSSMAFIDGTVVNVALPALQSGLQATVSQVQWVVEAYALFLASLLLVGGSSGDRFGRRKVFLIGVVIFSTASLWCGLAGTISQLIAARSVQGVGAAFLVPGSLALISASFPPSERGRAIGTWSGFTAITAAIGPVLGGWLVQNVSWRWIFFLNLPLGLVVFVISLWRVPESRRVSPNSQPIDWLGALLATAGLGGVVVALVEWGQGGAAIPIIGALGLICLVLLIVVERRAAVPMLPLALFRSRDFSGANLLTLFLYTGLSGVLFFLPLNLIQVQNYSATEAGAALLPLIVLLFLLSRWSGGLTDRYGARLPLIAGPLIASVGFALFTIPSVGGSYWATILPAVLVLGFGMAISVAPLTATVMGSVEQESAGTASGINNAVSRIAGLMGIALFGLILLTIFNHSLDRRIDKLSLATPVRKQLDAQRSKLAAAKSDDARASLAVKYSFIDGYRVVLWMACALSVASSASAALLIRPGKLKS